ncbi:hypothetical protein [Amycolatopsis vastitatis]|nr:hypothetical protein [Amycolatopsis vastitatis]
MPQGHVPELRGRLPLPTVDGYGTSCAISGGSCVLAILAALIVPVPM